MKISKLFVVFFSAVFFLLGCQENPAQDYIINKNEDVMEAVIAQTKNEGVKEDLDNDKITETYEKFSDDFTNDSGDVVVSVNADLKYYDVNFPVIRVEPHNLTADEVKMWADILFEGLIAYEPSYTLSKVELEKRILQLQNLVLDKDRLYEEYGDEQSVQSMVKYYNDLIEGYKSMYDTAPEYLEKNLCDWTFRTSDYYMENAVLWEGTSEFEKLKKTYEIQAIADLDNGLQKKISAATRTADDYKLNNIFFFYSNEKLFEQVTPYKEISENEAIEIGDKLVDLLGMKDWSLYKINQFEYEDSSSYTLTYTMTYKNIPVINEIQIDLHADDLYASNYYNSVITICIYNGVVRSVELLSPMDIVDILNEDVEVISFEDAYNSFKRYIETQVNMDAYSNGILGMMDFEKTEVKVDVSSIEQGFYRIREKNNNDEYLLIPVWNFKGEISLNGMPLAGPQLCMVNGLDGSIINTNLGY